MRIKSYAHDEADPLVPAFDGMQNLKMTEAIVLAAKTGQTVAV
jgi:hypothetical protein